MDSKLFGPKPEYGHARIEFPDGSVVELENVLVNAKGACVFELTAHSTAEDDFKCPVKSYGPLGQEHNIPPAWLYEPR